MLQQEVAAADARARERELQADAADARARQRESEAVASAARQAEAEQVAKREAAERARADTDARLARAAEAAARGRLDDVRRELDAKVIGERDAAIDEFKRLWNDKMRRGITEEAFGLELGEARLHYFLSAYDRLIDSIAPMTGLELTAEDFFNRAIIRSCFPVRDWPAIVADYDRAIELDPTEARAYTNRGIAKIAMGQIAEALPDYDRAIELNPRLAGAYTNRANVRNNLGDVEGAIADYDRAIDWNPRLWQAWGMRGMLRINANIDRVGGARDLQQAYRLCTDPEIRHEIAGWLHQLGAPIPD